MLLADKKDIWESCANRKKVANHNYFPNCNLRFPKTGVWVASCRVPLARACVWMCERDKFRVSLIVPSLWRLCSAAITFTAQLASDYLPLAHRNTKKQKCSQIHNAALFAYRFHLEIVILVIRQTERKHNYGTGFYLVTARACECVCVRAQGCVRACSCDKCGVSSSKLCSRKCPNAKCRQKSGLAL